MRSLKTTTLFFLALAAFPWRASAQNYDSSGDSMLSGTYYIRQVIYSVQENDTPEGTVGDAVNTFGNITFDGKGNYTISGSYLDAASGSSTPTTFTGSGTYVISASGMGYITAINPELSATDQIIGMVSPKGIFIGSTTQNTPNGEIGYNDLVIAAPVGSGSSEATNATLSGAYQIAYMDPTYFPASSALPGGDALITFTADGQGNIGTANVTGYISDNSSAGTESLTGVTYAFTNGAAQLNFGGSNTALVEGTELLYISPDGNFVFGGSANGFDMFVGVRSATSNPTNYTGLYYQAGLDLDQAGAGDGYVLLDSYYGALSVAACSDAIPCPSGYNGYIIGDQSLNAQLIYTGAADYTYYDLYTLNGDGSSTDADFGQEYFSSADGTIRIGYSNAPAQGFDVLGINVALQTVIQTGTGVYLSPQGMVNAGSSAPFTAHLSPGEYLTLYGSGLAPSAASAPSLPLTKNLNGVTVLINGVQAPINFVSPTQINVVVPFETTQAVAQIQVTNNSVPSNTVTQFVGSSSAGVFTYDPAGGIGQADAQDVTAGYSTVGPSNPAQIGDTIALYMAGLGPLTTTVADGAAGPSTSSTVNNPLVYIDDSSGASTQATVLYSGLAPGFAGLYQIDFTVPAGVASGPAALEIIGGLNSGGGYDSDTVESGFQVGTSSDARPAARFKSGQRPLLHHHRLKQTPLPSTGTRPSAIFDPQRSQH
jgi:uncharacterized protein (TIGR03437 family)